MKKSLYILLAIPAIVLASCAKEVSVEEPQKEQLPKVEAKTLTFNASIELKNATKADLDGLKLKWTSSDKVGVATNVGTDIKVCKVVPDETDATKATITVSEVDEATTYYFLYTGHDDFSAISFDKNSATFSGCNYVESPESFSGLIVGHQQVGAGVIDSNNYYGAPLSMAGKAELTSSGFSSLQMIPCLALIKLGLNAESVAGQYVEDVYTSTYNKNHTHYYSGIRGFNFYQGLDKNTTVFSSGAYSVNLSADNMVVSHVAASETKQDKNARQRASSSLLKAASGDDALSYYFCVIPGGSIPGFHLGFLGFSAPGTYNYSDIYDMTLSKNLNVQPGEFYDLGVLNPVGRQKTKDRTQDELDDAQPAFVPAIDIDGSFNDWTQPKDGVTILSFENDNAPGTSSANRIARWKVTSDEKFIYFYYEIGSEKITSVNYSYIYAGLDIGNDGVGQYSVNENIGGTCDVKLYFYPFVLGSDPVSCSSSENGELSYDGSTVGKVNVNGKIDGNAFIEVSIPRDKIGNPGSNVIVNVNHSYQGWTVGWHTFTLK